MVRGGGGHMGDDFGGGRIVDGEVIGLDINPGVPNQQSLGLFNETRSGFER